MPAENPKHDEIKLFILNCINSRDENFISRTARTFNIRKPTVLKYVEQMEEENVVRKIASTNSYQLVKECRYYKYEAKENPDEDRIFHEDIRSFINDLPKNVFEIWRYGFTEMMNNALCHAEAGKIRCMITRDVLNTRISIKDDGIGIFQKIRSFYAETKGENITLDDAVIRLTAGKMTTDRECHPGEGIFFTYKLFDKFGIFSDDRYFSRNTFMDGSPEFKVEKGTIVLMELSNYSDKDLNTVFDYYMDTDRGFIKTQIPIASFFSDGYPVTRAEAKRLGALIGRFEEAELDFGGVENLGQAFTHELFVVFPKDNPQTRLIPLNCGTGAEKMIRRVLAEA